MSEAIAIVGMACRFPDARSPVELWENVLASRRSFRRIPAARLDLGDYHSPDRRAPDHTYSTQGAFVEGFEFDRARFCVPGETYRATDPAHWLALTVAEEALEDAGFGAGEGLPRELTGVFVGNTLTGDFSRAHSLRLRWPYVRRVLLKALEEQGMREGAGELLARVEGIYKQPFPPVGEETLAGGLSNTIGGRICNHFGLKGGGYTLDGACASSLLAVVNACAGLAAGDISVALAGGVDLSVDPFELIGFAKTGALAEDEMRVYDRRSAGFWPGEGCGFVVLMRRGDALARGLRPNALIRGWGISSDGGGGITRPEVEGQLLALRRAYARAGYGIDTVSYFEGHGTGTAVGDATELQALSQARRAAAAEADATGTGPTPAAISSVKANIGHTKAAAGVAGLIKAAMVLRRQLLPPTTGCESPHERLRGDSPALRVLRRGEMFPPDAHLRAGVSAMGFGGINAHVTLEAAEVSRRYSLNSRERALITTAQDAEVFLFGACDLPALRAQVARTLAYAGDLSRGELTDLSAALAKSLGQARVRAAVVASSPAELALRLAALSESARVGAALKVDDAAGVFFGAGPRGARVGFLFPGQGAPAYTDGGAWRRRFACVEELYAGGGEVAGGDGVWTAVAQPAIAIASAAALRVLARLGVTASVAVGHSLGELCALHWAGSLDEAALLRTARARGLAMAEVGGPQGAMLSVGADERAVRRMLNGDRVYVAGLNSPTQTVISGEAAALTAVARRFEARGLRCTPLRVSHAFHSPLIAPAVARIAEHLAREQFAPPRRAVVSTVTGKRIGADADLRELLCRQVTDPVRFAEAVAEAAKGGVDLWLEVGPGRALTGLAAESVEAPVVALDACGASLRGLLNAAAACFVAGAEFDPEELFAGRLARPFDFDWRPHFFVNPCELAPHVPEVAETRGRADGERATVSEGAAELPRESEDGRRDEATQESPLEVVRRLTAERLELPPSRVTDDSRLLDDLHLNSINVAQLVADAARRLGLPPPPAPTNYANSTLSEIAAALEAARGKGVRADGAEEGMPPQGVAGWVRAFVVALVPRQLRERRRPAGPGRWRVIAPVGHPLAAELQESFARLGAGHGVVVALPPGIGSGHVPLLLEGARAALEAGEGARFVLVQHGGGAASFARTLHLEAKHLVTCVLDVPAALAGAARLVTAEALAARGHVEAHYDAEGSRRVPVLRALPQGFDEEAGFRLSAADVLLVSGGARGITAECALALARESGARLALFGLTRPEDDAEIAANVERMKAAGVAHRFYRVDVTDAAAVGEAVREVEKDLGPVTGILHGAARNVPCLIENLDAGACEATLRPKVDGAINLLAAVDAERLRLLITFGSIIARAGLAGEAHYGLANEQLTLLTERWQAQHAHCRCLAVEWSVWSGLGMGARLGTLDALTRLGVTPLTPEQGVGALRRLLRAGEAPVSAVVMSRFPELPTFEIERGEQRLLRFVEKPRVHYPNVELVADAVLSAETDPYLVDHEFRGERLLPAVMGLEAMAQAVMALKGTREPPDFEEVSFDRPVTVSERSATTVRVAALEREDGRVEVVLRSSETDFQADHFRASCRVVPRPRGPACPCDELTPDAGGEARVQLEPERDLYGKVLFHRGRFRRVAGYRVLHSDECLAEIAPGGAERWLGAYLPADFVLGDPGARDAAIHAVQACVPQAALLPVGVGKISYGAGGPGGATLVRAKERERFKDGFVYDLELLGPDGRVRERWERLRLRAVSGAEFKGPWPAVLLGPYVERRARELLRDPSVSVAFVRDCSASRAAGGQGALARTLGTNGRVLRRADGKPEARDGRGVSVSHAGELTMAVAASARVGCDVERVEVRSQEVWGDILGGEHFALAGLISREAGESADVSATRVWSALECLKKAGAGAPLVLGAAEGDAWVTLAAGALKVASCAVEVEGGGRLVVAVAGEGGQDARL